MPALTVTIHASGNITYDPTSQQVPRGETVAFVLDDATEEALVNFGPTTPLDQSQFSLNGTNPTTASQVRTVMLTATLGRHTFMVTPTHARKHKDPLPAGGVSGDIEVTPEPPKEG